MLAATVEDLPSDLLRSLNRDQGMEMAQHAKFIVAPDCRVYFWAPHLPWQHAYNENTNGLVRDYFLEGTDSLSASDEQVR